MDTDLKDKAIYIILSLAISVSCVYFFMIEPINSKAKADIKAHLESPNYGPFDEALAKSAGMEDILKKKPKWKMPEAKPLTFSSDWSNNFPKFDRRFD